MTPSTLRHVRTDPAACAFWLSQGADLWATTVTVVRDDDVVTILDAIFEPPPQLPDYPEERVRVVVRHDGAIFAVPVPSDRSWEHRYDPITVPQLLVLDRRLDWHYLLGALCLWYADDPPNLQWSWELGLDAYMRLIQRHVWDEEYFRRNGTWPAEDAPHGRRRDGRPHPILTEGLRRPA